MAIVQDAMKGLQAMLKSSEAHDKNKVDYTTSAANLEFNKHGDMVVNMIEQTVFGASQTKSKPMGFTQHGLSQLLARFSPQYFTDGSSKTMPREVFQVMREKFPKEFASIMNDLSDAYAKNTRGGGEVLVRSYKDGRNANARAFLSDRYGIVDNTALLQGLTTILKDEAASLPDMRLVRSTITPDELDVQVVWQNVKGQNPDHNRPQDGGRMGKLDNTFGLGVAITNGEIGNRGISVCPIIWRFSCTNSIRIQTDQAINLRHIGNPEAMMAKIKVGMIDCLPLASESLNRVFEAERKQLPSIASVLRGFAQEYKWDTAFTDAAMIGTEGKSTVMAVVNGISYAAHAATANLSQQIEASELAGRMLVAPDSLFARAAQIAEQQVVSVAGSRRRR